MGSLSFKVVDFAIQLAVILFAISFHESAHAFAALRFGDTTARDLGRISLNPLRHIDPFGSVLLPILLYFTSGLIFGYAKPTPVDLRRTKNPRLADLAVSAAGPLSNFLLAGASLFVLFAVRRLAPESFAEGFATLRGGRPAGGVLVPITYVVFRALVVNFSLGVFNLVPIPPLDGSHVLASVLGDPARRVFAAIAPFGFLVLVLLSSSRLLGQILSPAFGLLQNVLNRVLS